MKRYVYLNSGEFILDPDPFDVVLKCSQTFADALLLEPSPTLDLHPTSCLLVLSGVSKMRHKVTVGRWD